jgi:hypothetical protein
MESLFIPQILLIIWIVIHCIRLIMDFYNFGSKNISLLFLVLQVISLLLAITSGFITASIFMTVFSILYYWFVKPKLIAQFEEEEILNNNFLK